jgi:hypothetical protein
MLVAKSIAEKVLNNLLEEGKIDICHEYGERGYSLESHQKGILLSNWNDFDKYPNFMEWLEYSYELEWSDEWIQDYEFGKLYRCSPDSYGWEQQYKITEGGEMITPDNAVEDWIEECKVDYNNTFQISALPSFIEHDDIIAEGFELVDDDCENGFYNRHDNPGTIAEDLVGEEGEYDEVLFQLSSVGQFAVNFVVYARKLE